MPDVEKDILLRVKAEPDKGNQKHFTDIAKQLKDLQKRATFSIKVGLDQGSKRDFEAASKKMCDMQKRVAKEASAVMTRAITADRGAILATAQAYEKMLANVRKATAATKEATATATQATTATTRQVTTMVDLTKRQGEVRGAQEQVIGSSNRMMGGFMSAARGAVALGVAGKDVEKVMTALLRVQGVVDLARGIGDLTIGTMKWLAAMKTLKGVAVPAKAAAARSHDLLAASQLRQAKAAGAAATANGLAAKAAGGLTVANTAAAGTGGAATVGGGAAAVGGGGAAAAGVGIGTLAAGAIAATAALVGLASFVSTDARKFFGEGFTEMGKSAGERLGLLDRNAGQKKKASSRLQRSDARSEVLDYRDRIRRLSMPKDATSVAAEYKAATQHHTEVYSKDALNPSDMRERVLASNRMADAEKDRLETSKKGLELEKQKGAAAIRAAQETLRLKNDELKTAKEALKAYRDATKSGRVRFGEADAGTQRSVIRAKQQLDAQGANTLSTKQRDLLRQFGGSQTHSALDADAERRAKQAGFDKMFFTEEQAEATKLQSQVDKTAQEIKAGIKVEQTLTGGITLEPVTVKLDMNTDSLVEDFNQKLLAATEPAMKKMEARIRELAVEAAEAARGEGKMRDNFARAASGQRL